MRNEGYNQMKISIAKETASGEKRVLVLPKDARKLVDQGHDVSVEKNAGVDINVYDKDYVNVGVNIVTDRQELFGDTDLLVKLKIPTPLEFNLMRNNILFSMLHHKQNPFCVYYLGKQGLKAVEIESIFNAAKERLVDATDITGEIGVLYAAHHMDIMPSEAKALILGYGRVGSGAIKMCNKLGINTKILRKEEYPFIKHFLRGKNLLINAISWPEEERKSKGYVVTEDMLDLLNSNAVVLDLAVDFPNPIQTCRPTDLSNPYYIEKGKVHIGIYGYPGLVPVSSSRRYSRQVLPLLSEIANNKGLENIAERGPIGKAIENAVVDPRNFEWKKFKPLETSKGLGE